MKKILTLSFIIFSTCISLQSWALPACPSNQNAYKDNCFGTYVWDDGEKYIGEWKDNTYHGQGTYTHASGDKYVGEWKDGNRNGQGTYYYLENNEFKGDIYVGEYKDGKMNGQGTYTYAEGHKYVGEYKDGLRHGQGIFTWADGAKEVGEFRNGMLNGFAIRYDRNGNILKEGIWKDDEFQYAHKKSSSSSNSNSKLNKYKEFCEEIGFTPGTEKFGECVLKAMDVE